MPIGVPREREEPGRLPAFVMAVAIHAAFVVFLIFGVSWQTKAPPPLVAELWNSLPAIRQPEPAPEPPKAEPEPPPPPKVEVKTPPPPPQPAKADIELKEKLEKEKKQKLERERLEQEKQEKAKKAAEEKKKLEDDKKRKEEDKRKADERAKKAAEAKAKADADAALAARSAAQSRVVDDWANKIRSLVRSRANVPETVTGSPEVQIRLKLLVTGAVFEGVVVKRSGNRVYDDAIERAIASIREWPTPSDPDVFRNNREVTLNIKHEK
jgi:colicin import membrane protein